MIHNGDTAKALEGLPEGIDHQATGFSLETELLVIAHIPRRNTVEVSEENERGTNRIPLVLLVVRIERAIQSIRTGHICGERAVIVFSKDGGAVPELMPAVGQAIRLACVGIASMGLIGTTIGVWQSVILLRIDADQKLSGEFRIGKYGVDGGRGTRGLVKASITNGNLIGTSHTRRQQKGSGTK